MVTETSDSTLANRLDAVQQEVRRCAEEAGRDPESIKLIAVSKTQQLIDVEAVVELGQTALGENTIQDALTKIPHMSGSNAEWHFIGHLQSKKAAKLVEHFSWIHTVDSLKLAQKLSSAMINKMTTTAGDCRDLNCLIQVNVSGEATKSGVVPGQLIPFLKTLLAENLPGLRWRGLMTIGVKADEKQTQQVFSQLKSLQQSCVTELGLSDFDQLSMGMSGDFCQAIAQGATLVRVGTSIFGERDVVTRNT